MKKAICGVLLALCLLAGLVPAPALAAAAVWDGSAAEAYAGGSGTAEDPYQIADGAQLALLAQQAEVWDATTGKNMTYGKYYVLTRDVDLGEQPWTPIGSYRQARAFEGCFDGAFHRITGLLVDAVPEDEGSDGCTYAGLFGYVNNGSVRDLSVSGTVRCTGCREPFAGGVAACLASTGPEALLSGCSFSGAVTVTAAGTGDDLAYARAGGVAGIVLGEKALVTDCRNDGTVTCDSTHDVKAGGIAGESRGRVCRCVNNGDVTAVSGATARLSGGQGYMNHVGGVVGEADGVYCSISIEACMNTGSVTARGGSLAAGGVVGYNSITSGRGLSDKSLVISCCSTGPVSGESPLEAWVGGVAGSLWVRAYTCVRNCYSAGTVTGGAGAGVGGVLGRLDGSDFRFTLENCYAAGAVSGGEDAGVGGVLGSVLRDGRSTEIKDCCYLRTAEVNDGLEGTGSFRFWFAALDSIPSLSPDGFADPNTFGDWDWDVWKMADGLDSPVPARPVLKDPDESDTSVPVTGVSLDERDLTLTVGETVQLTAAVLPEDAADKTVLWRSSDPAAIPVDEDGTVSAVAEGTARITAAAGDREAVCTVTVVPARITAMTLTEEKAEVSVLSGSDGTAVLAAFYWNDRCQAVKVLPLEAGAETVLSLDLTGMTASLRLFLLDSGGAPLTGAEELLGVIPGRR